MAAWSRPRASSRADNELRSDERHVAGHDEHASTSSDRTASAARSASPVPRGSAWSAVSAVVERGADGVRGGEKTTSGREPVAVCAASIT